MTIGERWRHLGETRAQRIVLIVIGTLLVIATPFVAVIPGPGGVVVFAAGFGMLLKGSLWVKKRFVRFKGSYPKSGEWVDWGLRRPSYIRRKERDGTPEAGAQQCDCADTSRP